MARKRQPKAAPPAEVTQSAGAPASTDSRQEVVFVRPHRHRGVGYGVGDGYFATQPERELLKQFGAIASDHAGGH